MRDGLTFWANIHKPNKPNKLQMDVVKDLVVYSP